MVLDDPFKRNNPNSHTLVILTNGSVQKPIKVYDGYDAHSEIENGLFREAKQAWFIQRPARNNADAFRSHVYLTVLMMALTAAFQTWMDHQDNLANNGQETRIRKFREKVRQENGNKLIIFDEDRCVIFDAYEGFILCGTNVGNATGAPEAISKRDTTQAWSTPRVASLDRQLGSRVIITPKKVERRESETEPVNAPTLNP